MKLVKEHINEKFTEDSDPIYDLGIGILFHKRSFKNMQEAYDFLYNIIPKLFKVKHPLDIVSKKYPQLAFKENFEVKLKAYFNNYISVESNATAYPFGWVFFDITDFKNYIVARSKTEGISEGVADKYAEREFHIPDESHNFDNKYKSQSNDKNKIIYRFNKVVYIVKNPIDLSFSRGNSRAIISKTGDLYVLNINFNTHTEMVEALVNIGELKDHPKWWRQVPKNFLTIQRIEGKKAFVIGESNEPMLDYVDIKRRKILNMPESIEKARPYYDPFIRLAQRKHPNFKFYNKTLDELNTKSKK